MTDQELRDLVARLAQAQEKTEQAQERTDREITRLLKAQEKAEKAREENGKEMDRLDKELKAAMRRAFEALGRLGNSLGQFTEGLVYPSIVKILRQRFKVHVVTQNPRSRRNGTELELDALGYSSGEHGQAYVVEIKSKFGEDQFQQFLKTLAAFPKFFPEHADKPVYGVVAAVTMPDNIRQRLLKAGIYVARIHDNICTLRVPRGFKPKAFHSGRRV